MRISGTGICSKGFTLLELVVILFIVSLGLAMAFPSFSLQKDAKLKSEAGRIAATLRYLNDSALSTKETFEMRLNFDAKTLHYRGPEGERDEKIEHLSEMTLQSKGKRADGEVTVFFGPAGANENVTITLASQKTAMTVFFNALSGRVKVSAHEEL